MSDEKVVEGEEKLTNEPRFSRELPLGIENNESSKKGRGRPKGSKNKEPEEISKDDPFVLLVEEVKSLRSELVETKKEVEANKRVPAGARLQHSKKKIYSPPPYSGPMKRVKFMRNDQPDNPMPVYLRKVVSIDGKIPDPEYGTSELVDFKDSLTPGKIYELPEPVVDFINSRSEPKYEERIDPANPRQTTTQIIGEKQRCYCVSV